MTENERPVLAREVAAVFERTGFAVSSHYLSGLAYRYVASRRARLLLPVYNFIDAVVFGLRFMERLRPFVLTAGAKRLMPPELDIVIPVYNEGRNIVAMLAGLPRAVTTPARVLICYDHADDDTLPAIQGNPQAHAGLPVELRAQRRTRRPQRGHDRLCREHGAVRPDVSRRRPYQRADARPMVALARGGCDIVCASRFMPGGAMIGCPPLKAALVRTANFTLRHLARLPPPTPATAFACSRAG